MAAFRAGDVATASRRQRRPARVLPSSSRRDEYPNPLPGQGRLLRGARAAAVGQCRLPHGAGPTARACRRPGAAKIRSAAVGPAGGHGRRKAGGVEVAACRPRRRHRTATAKPTPVRVVFLGGLGEIGRNCACIEVDGRILVLDCGIMFPDPDMPGVDLVLPDFTYLRENADRVDGVVLTHGHEDHTGGLAYLLRDFRHPSTAPSSRWGWPGTGSTRPAWPTVPVHLRARTASGVRIGPCDVEFIPVTHSVPHAIRHRLPHSAGRRSCTRATSRSTCSPSTADAPTWRGWARWPGPRASACCCRTRPTPRSPASPSRSRRWA